MLVFVGTNLAVNNLSLAHTLPCKRFFVYVNQPLN